MPADVEVKIDSGQIVGHVLANGSAEFRGIPYAAPPLGQLRWTPPQPPAQWGGVRAAHKYAPACLHPRDTPAMFERFETEDEDCLYLNVWTPSPVRPGAKLPVMAWIHGGAFMTGTASDEYLFGGDLAQSNVVVVNFNYRLGPFGFLAHPALSAESPQKVSGNYGLLDQIAALRWIQRNIAAFGGDPGNVTLFGESAGGRSVATLMVSPLAKGLFHKAIMQSSSLYRPMYSLTESWYGRPSMEDEGRKVVKNLGLADDKDVLAALRAAPADEIMKAAVPELPGMLEGANAERKGIPWEPAADGWVLPGSPSDLWDAGRQVKIPVLAGSNADEGSLFMSRIMFLNTSRAQKLVQLGFPEDAPELLQLYPFNDSDQARDQLNKLAGDMNSAAPMRNIVRRVAQAGEPSWLYYYTYVRDDWMGRKLGAWHGAEIRFVFNSLDRGKGRVNDADRELARIMSGYWVNFARTGNPNGPELPQWPRFTLATEAYQILGKKVESATRLREPQLDFFSQYERERRSARSDRGDKPGTQ